ncbi:hypothetical protein HN51_061868 [Arachis hypogaea]|nr:uncharacterized protein DS421_11g327070 [Arachis hypogaea]
MHNYFVLFLALVAFHGCNTSHGRKIMKPLKTNIENHNTPHPLNTLGTTITSPKTKVEKHKMAQSNGETNAFRPTTRTNPGADHKKFTGEDSLIEASTKIDSPKSKISVNGVGPGPSPGSGHKIITGKNTTLMKTMVEIPMNGDEGDNNLKKPMVTAQSVDGIGPSHSPGVGHKP